MNETPAAGAAGRVPPERLRWRCDPAELPFETTQEIEPLEDIIGQDRATGAIRLGLEVPGEGYNIFLAGFVGTGRNTTIKRFLEKAESGVPPAEDLAYVNNFSDPDRPRLLRFPPGKACQFRSAMRELVERLRKEIPKILESEPYAHRWQEALNLFAAREKQVAQQFEERLAKEGFTLAQTAAGPLVHQEIVPMVAGQPVPLEQLEKMAESQQFDPQELERLRAKREELMAELREAMKRAREVVREREEHLAQLERQAVEPVVHELIERIAAAFLQQPDPALPHDPAEAGSCSSPPRSGLPAHLEEVERNILDSIEGFRGKREGDAAEGAGPAPEDPFRLYEVNVIVDNSGAQRAPVINENFPSFRNLFGAIERDVERPGMPMRSDFTRIKAGSLIRANGGHLVLNALDVLGEPGVWTMLKRVLRTGVVEIQSADTFFLNAGATIKPEPIEVRVKVVMIGQHQTYLRLYDLDEDFRKIFKIKADFDVEMPNDGPCRISYARFVKRIVGAEKLLAFDRTGVAALVEEGARAAGRRDRLTTRFNDVADLVRESCYWARREGSGLVREEHVDRAVRERVRRVGLLEDKVQELLDRGLLLVDTQGSRPGQVNGLSVYQVGDHDFGRPTRITATIGMGRQGIVNIERESRLSGPTHDKGVLILTGFLRDRFARDKPLTLSASLCFEQSYYGVDGDSASSAEVYALLSALSSLPFRQDLAVTGSINQKGEIQPIGGVNHKIEGFFDTCAPRGLTGRQGVLIPRRNLDDLMLRKDVVETVRKGLFHVYGIDSVEEGVELLSGYPAGVRDDGGRYPEGTLMARADARLGELAERIRPYGPADLT